MSHYSAEIRYSWTEGRASFYYRGRKNGDIVEEIRLAKPYRLSSTIHEINECEITNLLLTKEFVNETKAIEKIRRTTKLVSKLEEKFGKKSFDGRSKYLFISHLISPYATGDCFMPRRKYRVFW